MKLPRKPSFESILSAPAGQLSNLHEVLIAHDLRDVVREGLKYIKSCEQGETLDLQRLQRYDMAGREFVKQMNQNGWDIDQSLLDDFNTYIA